MPEPLQRAVIDRCHTLGLTLGGLAQALDRHETTVRSWLKGQNRVTFEDVEALDRLFADRGLPGLFDEMRWNTASAAPTWRLVEEPIQPDERPDLRVLLAVADGLRNSGRQVADYLAETGYLKQAHILMITEDQVFPVHCGADIPLKVAPSVIGRDLRSLNDPAYGLFLYRNLRNLAAEDRTQLQHIQSTQVDYRRVAVPVQGRFIVTLPFDVFQRTPLELQ
ncbi:hypothetical protein [Ferrovibrio sp.]|uniref:hypothetical protein n=1 Tax=Ferrovibrio sp. TaxID=1917215 RepID=UPI0025B87F09|nr:hypothetical protein [Ferrovibrio sp.]MBX3455705.1 hypothetical protein [Ferrovibrio sp.]